VAGKIRDVNINVFCFQLLAVAAEELKSMNSLKFVDLRENPLSDNLKSQLLEREDWRLLI